VDRKSGTGREPSPLCESNAATAGVRASGLGIDELAERPEGDERIDRDAHLVAPVGVSDRAGQPSIFQVAFDEDASGPGRRERGSVEGQALSTVLG
jgi:hypothetical protein